MKPQADTGGRLSMIDAHYMASLSAHLHGRNFLRPAESRVRQMYTQIERSQSLYYVTVSSVYSVAQATMTDALGLLRTTRHYRHGVKQAARQAMQMYDAWERHMRAALQQVGRWQLWLDLSDEVYESVRPELEALRAACLGVMEGNGEEEAELKAALVWSESVCAIAAVYLDHYLAAVQKGTGIDISSFYGQAASFDPIYRTWQRACGPVLRIEGAEDINLNNVPACRKAMDALQDRLYSMDIYDDAGAAALRLNIPEATYSPDAQAAAIAEAMGEEAKGVCPAPAGTTPAPMAPQEEKAVQNDKKHENMPIGPFYEAKVKYQKPQENGAYKEACEKFIVEACSMTEVEAAVYAELSFNGETPQMTGCSLTKVKEIWDLDYTDQAFKVCIDTVTMTDEGKTRRNPSYFIVRAADIGQAQSKIDERLKAFGPGFELRSIQKAGIAGVMYRRDSEKKRQ